MYLKVEVVTKLKIIFLEDKFDKLSCISMVMEGYCRRTLEEKLDNQQLGVK